MDDNSHNLDTRRHPAHLPNVERFNQSIILFVTVCTKDRKPILANERMHDVLRHSWNQARNWTVGRYIIMPDHVHLFCSPAIRETEPIQKWAGYWKRLVSCEVQEHRPLWQRDCWDRQLRNAGHYGEKWEYVSQNPVRKGLVEQPALWPFQGEMNVLRW